MQHIITITMLHKIHQDIVLMCNIRIGIIITKLLYSLTVTVNTQLMVISTFITCYTSGLVLCLRTLDVNLYVCIRYGFLTTTNLLKNVI